VLIIAGFAVSVPAADTNKDTVRLTVELRDGSRVVGQNVDEKMKFHSALLGDFKLAVGEIRSVEFTATNAVKLTTANGDALAVRMTERQIPVRTSFGNLELPVDSIRKISVTTIGVHGPKPPGLVALWPGEDNGNNAVWTDIVYTGGKVGRAFWVNLVGSYGHLDLWFGRRPGDQPSDRSYHSFYSGIMDEICVYDRALSLAEIKSESGQ